MTLLAGRLELHGVDVELLAQRAVNTWLQSHRSHLQEADRDDLAAYVVAELWRASLTYDQSRSRVSFATYAYRLAGARIVDWYRLRFGRSRWQFGDGREHVRERPIPISLDRPTADGHRLVDSLADRAGDSAADHAADLSGLLGERGCSIDRDLQLVRAAATRAARRGAQTTMIPRSA